MCFFFFVPHWGKLVRELKQKEENEEIAEATIKAITIMKSFSWCVRRFFFSRRDLICWRRLAHVYVKPCVDSFCIQSSGFRAKKENNRYTIFQPSIRCTAKKKIACLQLHFSIRAPYIRQRFRLFFSIREYVLVHIYFA